ncbi:MAG: hypothetical protein HUU15_02840 [Candidatus Brocadiae bacterium]|nr:hypothetical protein [Candidatus Brocadiia bacterium]
MRRAGTTSLLLGACLLAGCGWLGDRARDAADIVHVDAGVGPQIGATVRLTHLLQAGACAEGLRWNRSAEDAWLDAAHLSWNGRQAGIHKRIGWEAGVGPESIGPRWYVRRWSAEYEEEYREQKRTADEIGFSIHVLFVGVEAGVRPAEFVDFLLGWFGLDILRDDRQRESIEDAERWREREERRPRDGGGSESRTPPPD